MKVTIAIILASNFLMVGIAQAQVRTVTKTGPNGKTLVLKMGAVNILPASGMANASAIRLNRSHSVYCGEFPAKI